MRIKDSPISVREFLEAVACGGSVSEVRRFSPGGAPTVEVYSLNGMTVMGNPAVIVTPTGEIIRESSAYGDFPKPLGAGLRGKDIEVDNVPFFDDECCLLRGVWDDQFWHWMMEYLPKALIAEEAGFTGRYLVPKGGDFIRQSLELLRIAPSRIIEFEHDVATFSVLTFVRPIEGFKELPRYPAIVNDLRRRLREAVGETSSGARARRLYIARKTPGRPRNVVNEPAVMAVLNGFSIERVYMEEMTLRQQISLSSAAAVLFGPHGAGMLHAMFMPEGSLVVECFSPHYILTSHVKTFSLLRHRYYSIVGANGPLWPYKAGMDVEVDITLLKATLDRELS